MLPFYEEFFGFGEDELQRKHALVCAIGIDGRYEKGANAMRYTLLAK